MVTESLNRRHTSWQGEVDAEITSYGVTVDELNSLDPPMNPLFGRLKEVQNRTCEGTKNLRRYLV